MNRRWTVLLAAPLLAVVSLTICLPGEGERANGRVTQSVAAAEPRKPSKNGIADLESCYRDLANSNSTDDQWVDAAERIVRWKPSTSVRQVTREVVGESLRSGKQPSVSELLVQRTEQLTGPRSKSNCRKLMTCLAKWDIQAALPLIRRHMSQIQSSADEVHWPETNSLSELLIAAIDAGATDLIEVYAVWTEQLKPNMVPFNARELLRPIGRFPDHPRIQQLAQGLFSEGSAWLPILPADDFRNHPNRDDLIASSLVSCPQFRGLLGQMLRDETVIGTCHIEGQNQLHLVYSNKSTVTTITSVENPVDPRWGDEVPLRVCDITAWKLSGLPGAPQFEPYWSEARRAQALPLIGKFLERWGHAFRDRELAFNQHSMSDGRTAFHLPPLDHVGTLNDVAEGRAIFSQNIPGTSVRPVALSTYPQPARWKKQNLPPGTTVHPRVHHDFIGGTDAGYVFQAEEVRENGFWKRYYGFCGTHILARIPASEIELVK